MSGKDPWEDVVAIAAPYVKRKGVLTLEEMDEAIKEAVLERFIRKRVRESDDWERVDEDVVVREFASNKRPTLQQIDAVVARLLSEGERSK